MARYKRQLMFHASCETLVFSPMAVCHCVRACGKCDFARSRLSGERLCRVQTDEPRGHFSGGGREGWEGSLGMEEERLPPSLCCCCCCRRGEGNFSSQVLLRSLPPQPRGRRWTDEDSLSSLVEILVAVLNGPNDNCEVVEENQHSSLSKY